ncbi:aminotransferase class I/II-fold pyridoxal phosphate-dependent enzyme [Elizabethkingia ursingii]|uniref:aminotransferase class I/II-fold pyridoxal phosphate-dependent enzyme n=1 Tax=Elizabethkingia ursingii TaxID=1756150 RepID=UPI002013B8F7|nr:aminotransferase class I/II-fold pyridoxal phosphate-dependent enzyme [Elizabethkingia ursingii]MCL1666781.1 aminotransferase class I/II-fold pyridoxal phosphate-dependent enzyme [Elizabethkingia ursingii]
MNQPEHWHKVLASRRENGNYRSLKIQEEGIDFLSNDYLGIAGNKAFQKHLLELLNVSPELLSGATGSRLISGNSLVYAQAEEFIARIHDLESALLFPSGYKANLALFSCIAGRHHTILVDELVHRSVHDGCALSHAQKKKFRHNDLNHLEYLLSHTIGPAFIAIESLYSMDGDFAPLEDIVTLAEQYGAWVIVDEAHAVGVFGKGLVHRYNLQNRVLATVITYGKAFGMQGAVVVGSSVLKEYLINFASPFIYSTAMQGYQVQGIVEAYQFLETYPHLGSELQNNIEYFRKHQIHSLSQSMSPVQIVQFPTVGKLCKAVQELKQQKINTYPIFSPTVKAGSERLRIALHQFNSPAEIDELACIIKNNLTHD